MPQPDQQPALDMITMSRTDYDLMRQVVQDAQALFKTLDEPSWDAAVDLLRRDTHRLERFGTGHAD